MTKKDRVKVTTELSRRLPELRASNCLLLFLPTTQTIRGVLLGSSGDPRAFYARAFFQPLFLPRQQHHALNLGWRLGGGGFAWRIDGPTMLDDLSELISSEAIPFLARIVSPVDVVAAARELQKDGDTYVQETIAFSLARAGRIIEAIECLSRLEETLNDQLPWQRVLSDDCRLLRELLMSNPGKAQEQLDKWQMENAATLRLAADPGS